MGAVKHMYDRSKLLAQVLEAYILKDTIPHLLQDLRNYIYRLDTADIRYSLRICPAKTITRRYLEEELTWLEFVVQQSLVRVPRPVRNQRDDLVTVIGDPEEQYFTCLFEWIEGTTVPEPLSETIAYHMGQSVAYLHQIAKECTFPSKENTFRDDYRYDNQLILSHKDWIDAHKDTIGAERTALLHAAVEYVLRAFDRIGERPDNFGIIHADLHLGNFLIQSDNVAIIDFDQLGHGYYCYDLAVIMVEFLRTPETFSQYWQSLKAGYQEIAVLPFSADRVLDPFIVAVQLNFLDWVYNTPNPVVRAEKWPFLPNTYAMIQSYMR